MTPELFAEYREENRLFLELYSGRVVCNIGQVDAVTKRALDRAAKRGEIAKWRGHWFPTSGAPWGIGPLKTCWALANPFDPMNRSPA